MNTGQTAAGRIYHHNGGYSGDILLVMNPDEVERVSDDGVPYVIVTLPAEDLLDIAADHIRGVRIEQLESAGRREILGLDPPTRPVTGEE